MPRPDDIDVQARIYAQYLEQRLNADKATERVLNNAFNSTIELVPQNVNTGEDISVIATDNTSDVLSDPIYNRSLAMQNLRKIADVGITSYIMLQNTVLLLCVVNVSMLEDVPLL